MADHKDNIYGRCTNYAPSPRPVYKGVLFDAVMKTSRDQRMSKPKKKQNKSVCGNAFVGSGFANSRKSKFIKKYNKLKKRTKEKNASSEFILKPLASDPLRKDDAEETLLLSQSRPRKDKKKSSNKLEIAKTNYQQKIIEKEQKRKEMEEARKEHEKIVNRNIQKRRKIHKQLSKRTKKGQPYMANQLNYLLNKIKNS